MLRWINKVTVSCILFLFGIGIYYLNRIPYKTKEELFPLGFCRFTDISDPAKLQYIFKNFGINYILKDSFTADDIVDIVNHLNRKSGGKPYFKNTFNKLPDYYTLGVNEYSLKAIIGSRQYIFYEKPSDDLIRSIKNHFGSIALIKARLARHPSYRSTEWSRGGTIDHNRQQCEKIFYGMIGKYRKLLMMKIVSWI